MSRDLRLVQEHIDTSLVLDTRGRVVRGNGTLPLFEIHGCRDGNVVVLRDDVPDDVAASVERLTRDEPALYAPGAVPVHDSEYVQLLGATQRFAESLEYVFLHRLPAASGVQLVLSGTDRAHDVTQQPFRGWDHPVADHISEPWCMALDDGEIASIVETVRLAGPGAECGVTTSPHLRRRGFAAAAIAGWASHPELRDRTLFYSTEVPNTASQSLTRHLGVHYLGASYRAI